MPNPENPTPGSDSPPNPFGDPTDPPKPDPTNPTNPSNPFDNPKDPPKPDPTNPSNPFGDPTKPDPKDSTGTDKPTDPKPPPPLPPINPEQVARQSAVDGAGQAISMLPGTAASLAQLPSVSLQLKAIDQKELRTFTAEYSSRKAIQRTYRPQGFFGLSEEILKKLPKGAFLQVDTNSEFWRTYEVKIHAPAAEDFNRLGLVSAVVQIDYGDPNGGTQQVSRSFRFLSVTEADSVQQFSNPMFPGYKDYRYTLTYQFNSSWSGDPAERTLPAATASVRDVFVIPQRDFRFVTVNASFLQPPDWTALSQIHLFLTCSSQSKELPESFEKTVVIHEGWMPTLVPADPTAPAQELPWRVRFKDPSAPVKIGYRLKYLFKDNTTRETALLETTNPNLALSGSFGA